MKRAEQLNHIRNNPQFPVLIIGAGVNGIGTFRDLALQGIDVLIVDKGDFCSGASAASSHMIHGGIRYLENGEFRLVKEAVQERNRLIENAPHLARPLPTNIPIFKRFSGLLNAPLKFLGLLDKPGERGALVIKIGLEMYDRYTGGQQTVPRHKIVGKKEALAQYPLLNPDVEYLATYYDGVMPSPERICIEMLQDAQEAHNRALALNYVTAVSADNDSVTLRDMETGEEFRIQPEIVINASGPWIDFTNDNLGASTNFIGGTKGSHIVVDHPELQAAVGEHEFFFENDDGRIVLILPIFNRVIIGTTDIPVDNPEDVHCTDEEVAYFLQLVKKIFPTIEIKEKDIVYRFAGVRPLPASDAKTAGQISRDHHNRVMETEESGRIYPIFNLIGGKWTTYRAFSAQVADEVLFRFGEERKISTANLPIGGGKDYPKSEDEKKAWITAVAEETGVPADRVEELLNRYGTNGRQVAQFISAAPDNPIPHLPNYSRREIVYIITHEQVRQPEDFTHRRSLIAMRGELTGPAHQEIAQILKEQLNTEN